ncbi:MAG: exodeoxyribonuclease V subunit alpha [Fibrobacter sp.]|nr:exodeoxyribonuclease V subunit alpha [Fibrobacter sp.]
MDSITNECMELINKETGFSSMDLHFAHFMAKIADQAKSATFLAAALANNALSNGHSFVDIKEHADKHPAVFDSFSPEKKFPSLSKWLSDLEICGVVGKPGTCFPLILCDTRLYLYRYWKYEQELAESILRIINLPAPEIDIKNLAEHLEKLFPDSSSDIWQKVAAAVSVFNRFTVISGGPGTGKTTTVTKIMALLLMIYGKNNKLRIALAAPTGKAAARLSESISSVLPKLALPENIQSLIPREAYTIHRLLGTIYGSPYFRFNSKNKLPYDIVVVDEASMIDLALMSKLFAAIPDTCRIVFLGDRNQLSSVEAGAAFGDICDSGNNHGFTKVQCEKLSSIIDNQEFLHKNEPPAADCIINLRKSYRFNENSGIGKLASAVNKGDSQETVSILRDTSYKDCVWKNVTDKNTLSKLLNEKFEMWIAPLSGMSNPQTALASLEKFRILCAFKKGPFGVESINSQFHQMQYKYGHTPFGTNVYRGQPIMIVGNNPKLDLFNGDTGLIIPDSSDNTSLKAVFKMPDSTFRFFNPYHLPLYDTAYSLTVHKSQGSEFDNVLLILGNTQNPLLTRELLYTAITRARKSVEIWSSEQVLLQAIKNRINRNSGLREKLWEN